jgi:hypothetical protein
VLTGHGVVRFERFSDRPAVTSRDHRGAFPTAATAEEAR